MIKVYDSKAVSCIAMALPLTKGLGDPFVQVEFDEEAFTVEQSIDGEVTRSKNYNVIATITITFKGTSVHNAEFSALHLADQKALGGAGIGVFYLNDNNGQTLYSSEHCWIQKIAPVSLGKTVGDKSWVLKAVMQPYQINGGN